jgi:hypothetical protein
MIESRVLVSNQVHGQLLKEFECNIFMNETDMVCERECGEREILLLKDKLGRLAFFDDSSVFKYLSGCYVIYDKFHNFASFLGGPRFHYKLMMSFHQ